MSSKGRTQLQISLSRTKNVEEAAGDICFCVFPQKTNKHTEKSMFSSKLFSNFPKVSKRIRTHPDASECIRMHPNASGCIRTGPNRSEQVRKLQKNLRKPRKHYKKIRENFAKKFANACRTLVFFVVPESWKQSSLQCHVSHRCRA